MRINDRITGINGVVAGGVATVELPVNRRYHGLTFYYQVSAVQAVIEADILWVRLLVNGVLIRDISPVELYRENIANGRAFVAGEIPIFFSEPWRASVMSEEATSWDTFGQNTLTVQFGISAAAIAPVITGVATFDYLRNVDQAGRPALNIVKWVRNTFNLPIGDSDLTTLNRGLAYQRITLGCAAPNEVSRVRVMLDGATVLDALRTEIANLLLKYGITVQAGTTPAWFDYSQQITDALQVGPQSDFSLRVTSAAAQACNVLSQVRVPGYM